MAEGVVIVPPEPGLDGADPAADALQRAQFTLVPWLDGAQRIYGEARLGRIADPLWIDCLVPSLIDSSLAPPGRHVMTCFVQYLPYRLATSEWARERARLEQQLLRQIAQFVPAVVIVLPFFLPYLELQQGEGFARSLDDSRRWSANCGASPGKLWPVPAGA